MRAPRPLHRRDLLRLGLGAGLVSPLLRAFGASAPPRRKLLVVFATGGWDVTYVFDPKLGVPGIEGPEFFADPANPDDVDRVETFGALPVVVNDLRRPSVRTFFAENAARTALVNGLFVGAIAHDPCRTRMLTGTQDANSADFSVICGAAHGADLPLGAVDLSGLAHAGRLAATAGRIGNSNQIKTLLDPTSAFPAPADSGLVYPLQTLAPAQEAAIRELQRARLARLFGARTDLGGPSDARLADLAESLDRAERFSAAASGVVSRLTLGEAPDLLTKVDLATDLLLDGVCASVLLETNSAWDSHVNNEVQNTYFEALFDGLAALGRHLDAKGLADDTTVVVLSEMTRTPKHNFELGKDHWQHTSVMLFGAGVRAGVSGGTSELLESLPMDLATGALTPAGELCKFDNFNAGILAMLDVDPAEWLPGSAPFLGAAL